MKTIPPLLAFHNNPAIKKKYPLYVTLNCVECGEDTTCDLVPYVPAKLTGHPDTWHPEEGGYIEPEECHNCGEKLPTEGLPF
jgi:hypothetical protein